MTLFSVSLGSCKPSENSVLRSAKRAPENVRRLNNISDVIFYCLVGERSRALALLNAALGYYTSPIVKTARSSNLYAGQAIVLHNVLRRGLDFK